MPKTLLSLDPGTTTGYAVVEATESSLEVIKAGTILWNDRFYDLQELVNEWPYDHIIVETFRLFPHKAMSQIGSHFPSAQVIGIIEFLLWHRGYLDRLVYQNPSIKARTQVMDDSIPNITHVQDAYRHARYFAITKLNCKC